MVVRSKNAPARRIRGFHHSGPEIPGSARDGKPRSFFLCLFSYVNHFGNYRLTCPRVDKAQIQFGHAILVAEDNWLPGCIGATVRTGLRSARNSLQFNLHVSPLITFCAEAGRVYTVAKLHKKRDLAGNRPSRSIEPPIWARRDRLHFRITKQQSPNCILIGFRAEHVGNVFEQGITSPKICTPPPKIAPKGKSLLEAILPMSI